MSTFTDAVDSLVKDSGTSIGDAIKALLASAGSDASAFVAGQAADLKKWTVDLANGDLTVDGFKRLVAGMDVLKDIEIQKQAVAARASAQKLSNGIRDLILNKLISLL